MRWLKCAECCATAKLVGRWRGVEGGSRERRRRVKSEEEETSVSERIDWGFDLLWFNLLCERKSIEKRVENGRGEGEERDGRNSRSSWTLPRTFRNDRPKKPYFSIMPTWQLLHCTAALRYCTSRESSNLALLPKLSDERAKARENDDLSARPNRLRPRCDDFPTTGRGMSRERDVHLREERGDSVLEKGQVSKHSQCATSQAFD